MAQIEKKIRSEIFEKLTNDKMHLDMRLADFDIETGDTIKYREWDPEKNEYTGRSETRVVKGTLSSKQDLNFWSDEDISKYGFYALRLAKE